MEAARALWPNPLLLWSFRPPARYATLKRQWPAAPQCRRTAQHSMHVCGGLGECLSATVQSGHGYDWNDRLLSEGWQLNGTRLCLRPLC